ncbi:MAG: hypothetical protein WBK28_00920 [Minisyncoccia bacterium]
MSTLRKRLNSFVLKDLATPSNITYGTAINRRGAIEIIEEKNEAVEAWAGGLTGSVIEGGGSRRRVRLLLDDGKLNWHCTGNPKNHDIFCKHCVAVALFLIQSD